MTGSPLGPLAVYPCNAEVQWVLFPDHVAVFAAGSGGYPRFAVWLSDLVGIEYKEPGLTSGSARIIVADSVLQQLNDEAQTIAALDAGYKSQRQGFLRKLATVAPGCRIEAVEVSPEKDLKRKVKAAQLEEWRQARQARVEAKRARQQADEASRIERSLVRPDGTTAPPPLAVIGNVFTKHLRLYTNALVFVDPGFARREGGKYENPFNAADLVELQWASARKRCYLAPPPAGMTIQLNIADEPLAISCSPEELEIGLKHIGGLYPDLAIRQVALLADQIANSGSTPRQRDSHNLKTALAFMPNFSADQHIVGINNWGLGLDADQTRLVVIDMRTWTARKYDAKQLMSVEVFEDGQSIARAHRAAKGGNKVALAGFLVGDGFSTFAGLAAANRPTPRDIIHEITLRIEIDDLRHPTLDVQLFQNRSHPIQKGSSWHRALSEEARTWAARISAMIRRAGDFGDEADPSAQPTAMAPQSIAAEIAQLAKLHSEGILSDEEFSQLKTRLISG